MSKHKYSATYNPETNARAAGASLEISTKQSIEICKFLRGKKLERAKAILSNVAEGKEFIPYTRFNGDVGHRRGKMAAGRSPIKACLKILEILDSAEKNAIAKGFSSNALFVKHICAQKGANSFRHGRQSRRKRKNTTVEIMLAESSKSQTNKEDKQRLKKDSSKKSIEAKETKSENKKEANKEQIEEQKKEPEDKQKSAENTSEKTESSEKEADLSNQNEKVNEEKK